MDALNAIWQNLTKPHPSIQSVERQVQSRYLASYTIVLSLVVMIAIPLCIAGFLPGAATNLALTSIMIGLVYTLNRRGYYTTAATVSIVLLFIIIHMSLINDKRFTIFFSLILLLVTGIFLSTRMTIVVIVASIGLQVVGGIVSPREYEHSFLVPLALMIFGGPVVLVFMYYRDAVENMRRSQLLASNEQLILSKNRWRSLVKNLPDVVVEIDPSGTILYSNIDYPLGSDNSVIGNHIATYVEQPYRALTNAKILDVIKSQQPIEYEVEAMNVEGEVRWFANRLSPVIRDEKVQTLILISRDVTVRKKVDENMLEMTLLKERIDVLQSLISTYSHDMKTPLATIDFTLSIIESVDSTSQHQLELETIRSQSSRLNVLIQNILTLSRLDQISELERTVLNLTGLLQTLQHNLLPTGRQQDVTMIFDVPSKLPAIFANELELDRAISNLIENAITYTPKGGTVLINAFSDETSNIVEIIDTGIGISTDDLPNIFMPFYRIPNQESKPEGTGLGLAIANRIIKMHNGDLSVESVIGKGSTFRLTIPIASTTVPEKMAAQNN